MEIMILTLIGLSIVAIVICMTFEITMTALWLRKMKLELIKYGRYDNDD